MSRRLELAGLVVAVVLTTPGTCLRAQEHAGHHPPMADTSRQRKPIAQERAMRMGGDEGPLGLPMSRDGSGTAWLPDSSPMHAVHRMVGPWTVMLHGNAFVEYLREGGGRGAGQLGSVNWAMAMASRSVAGGRLTLRAMLSAEPLTVGRCGYPDLLATGEQCNGQPLHDRQHPHDVFMELSAGYERALSDRVAVQLYAAPAGEPALGPVAYPHRLSAMPSPVAPISHHWLDATHISFGVVTGAVYGRKWKLEGSVFNGREPDDRRFNLDLGPLDSYAARLWILPGPEWAIQASIGRLHDVEPGTGSGRVSLTRTTASATRHVPLGARGAWATTLAWGRNAESDHATDAVLAESSVPVAEGLLLFAQAEWARKTGKDLALGAPTLADQVFSLAKASAGVERRLPRVGELSVALGGRLDMGIVPGVLEPYYGSRAPLGAALFLSVRPGASAGMSAGMFMEGGMGHGP